MILLDEMHYTQSFWETLLSTRGIYMGTFDFCWEHARFKAIVADAERERLATPALSGQQPMPAQ